MGARRLESGVARRRARPRWYLYGAVPAFRVLSRHSLYAIVNARILLLASGREPLIGEPVETIRAIHAACHNTVSSTAAASRRHHKMKELSL